MKKETIKQKIADLENYRENCRAELYVTIGKIAMLEEMLNEEENKDLELGETKS